MNFAGVTGTVAVLLFFATSVPAYAEPEGSQKQEEKQPQEHAGKPQQRAQQPKEQHAQKAPEQRPQRAAQPKQQEQRAQPRPQLAHEQTRQQSQPAARQTQQARQQPQRTEQQARSWQQQRAWAPRGSWQAHANFQQSRSVNWSSDHRTWAQRGGYGGFIIPQATFGLSFGSAHFFHIGGMPVMYMSYPRFAYGGYSFLMVDPYPGDWSPNWYASDDVYIDYNAGYYLCNRRYPQERLSISVVL